MVPLIEERLQDFRPKELVQIADAYVARLVRAVGPQGR